MENRLGLVGKSSAESGTTGTNKQVSVTSERVPGYGELLHDKIRTKTKDFNALNAFERFILNRGYLYDTEEKLKAGYGKPATDS